MQEGFYWPNWDYSSVHLRGGYIAPLDFPGPRIGEERLKVDGLSRLSLARSMIEQGRQSRCQGHHMRAMLDFELKGSGLQ